MKKIRACVAVLVFCLALYSVGAAATLLSVRAQTSPGTDPRITLTFDSGVPQYRIYGNNSTDVTLVLFDTARASNTQAVINGKDSLKSVTLDTVADGTEVTFHAEAKGTLHVNTGSGQSLIAVLATRTPAPPSEEFGATGSVPSPPALAPVPGPDDNLTVVPLKYADISEVIGLLAPGQQIPPNDSFAPQEQTFGQVGIGGLGQGPTAITGTGVAGTASAPGAETQSLGQQITPNIGVDRRMNAIVLSGTSDEVARLERKIEELDIPLPSVVLETSVVELTDTAAKDLGIDYTQNGGPVATVTYNTNYTNTTNTTNNNGLAYSLQASVYAQVLAGKGKIISRPRIVAQNGQTAQILTGDALPIVTSIAVSGVNAVSQQVQYVNVGVSLQILPRIGSDGYVTSHVFSEVSNVTGYQQGYPTLSQREAITSARVKDGESFVIGGLLQNSDISSLAKVPGLGDLPIIGGLFRVRHDTSQNTNLYIIVTPHILTTGEPAVGGQ